MEGINEFNFTFPQEGTVGTSWDRRRAVDEFALEIPVSSESARIHSEPTFRQSIFREAGGFVTDRL